MPSLEDRGQTPIAQCWPRGGVGGVVVLKSMRESRRPFIYSIGINHSCSTAARNNTYTYS